jgi:pimeloyl-ACP methyl ester carboxylesterase
VPGITASFLSFDRFGGKPYYPDPVAMATNNPFTAALAADGVSPNPNGGQQLYPFDVYQFQQLRAILQPQLPSNFSLTSFPYDWRLLPSIEADRLWTQIKLENTPDSPATLLCHSMGGLVGCLVYRNADAENRTNLIRRVICLGSPLGGSYAVVKVAGQLLTGQVDNTLATLFSVGAPLLFQLATRLARLLVFTLPGFVSLFPNNTGNAAYGDPKRGLLYDPASYPDLNQPFIAAVLARQVPVMSVHKVAVQLCERSGVLVTVSGTSALTAAALRPDATDILPASLLNTFDGDGLVTVRASQSSFGPGSTKPYTHNQLPLSLASDGSLAALITAPVSAPVVTPDPFTPPREVMQLVPVVSLPLLAVLNPLSLGATKYTVLGFTAGNPTLPYVRGMWRSQRLAWKYAMSLLPVPGAVYTFSGNAWFYVPTADIAPIVV